MTLHGDGRTALRYGHGTIEVANCAIASTQPAAKARGSG
jgi:hypothetical protein